MTQEANTDQLNEQWFEFYTKQLASVPKAGVAKVDKYFLCPCCYFPTLKTRADFEICFLCNWEDDGQGDHNADLVLGGPNQSYSLTEARQNFISYLTSYRPSDTYHFARTTVKKSKNGQTDLDLTEIKKQVIDKYNAILSLKNAADRKSLFAEINRLVKKK